MGTYFFWIGWHRISHAHLHLPTSVLFLAACFDRPAHDKVWAARRYIRLFRKFSLNSWSISPEFTGSCLELTSSRTFLRADRHFLPWQGEVERRAVVQLAFGINRSAVGAHDMLSDRQPEAGPARFARARLVHAVEALKQPWQMLAGDSGTKIADVELHAILRFTGADQDLPAFLAILHGVVDQIAKHLMNCVTIH